jgi:predicted DNA-binding transcriptional regulator YafY
MVASPFKSEANGLLRLAQPQVTGITMTRSERLLKLIETLRQRVEPATSAELGAQLGVQPRTIAHDLGTLRANGVEIRKLPGRRYALHDEFSLLAPGLSADEAEAVVLGLRWAMRKGDQDLARAAEETMSKLSALMPPGLRRVVRDVPLTVSAPKRAFADRIDLGMIRHAIRAQHKVALRYRDEDKSVTERTVQPLGITYLDSQRIIVAWCDMRQGVRTFRTDRIQAATELDENFGLSGPTVKRPQRDEQTDEIAW